MLHSKRVRGGSATVHFPIWHREIEDILVLKNNKGTEDNRVQKTRLLHPDFQAVL